MGAVEAALRPLYSTQCVQTNPRPPEARERPLDSTVATLGPLPSTGIRDNIGPTPHPPTEGAERKLTGKASSKSLRALPNAVKPAETDIATYTSLENKQAGQTSMPLEKDDLPEERGAAGG